MLYLNKIDGCSRKILMVVTIDIITVIISMVVTEHHITMGLSGSENLNSVLKPRVVCLLDLSSSCLIRPTYRIRAVLHLHYM